MYKYLYNDARKNIKKNNIGDVNYKEKLEEISNEIDKMI